MMQFPHYFDCNFVVRVGAGKSFTIWSAQVDPAKDADDELFVLQYLLAYILADSGIVGCL